MKKSITWLKGLAMLMIVISHMYTVAGVEKIYAFCDDLGRLGVIIFISISGVIYGLNPNRIYAADNWKDIISHIHKKVKPLYPMYLVFLLIMFTLRCTFGEKVKYLFAQLAISIPLLQSFVPYRTVFAYSLNTPMWYLSMMLALWGGYYIYKENLCPYQKAQNPLGYCVRTAILSDIGFEPVEH